MATMPSRKKAQEVAPQPEAQPPAEAEPAEAPGRSLCESTGASSPRLAAMLMAGIYGTTPISPNTPPEVRAARLGGSLDAVGSFAPRDAIEGMMAAQAVALHHAAMECARRALHPDLPPGAASRLRREAANLSRAMVDMAEALDRRRGKGVQQRIVIERVDIAPGSQGIVGIVTPPGKEGGGRG
jgi:hypothetical protein